MFSNFKTSKSKTARQKVEIPLLSRQDPDPFFLEAYRTLITNIQFCQPTKSLKTLLVTSTGPQEGKSTIVSNLGILLAQGGSKVLLIDADLRAPTLCKAFNVKNYSGLTDLLLQISSTQITDGDLDNFSVGDAFQVLKIQKKTGILRVNKEETVVSFFFKDGEVIESHWRDMTNTKALGEIFRIKDGTFHFQETVSLNDHIAIPDNLNTEDSFQNTIPQIYRQPYIESRVDSFLKPTNIENLTLLSSGRIPPNPQQLLGSESMKTLLNIVKNRFDAVIIDSPPAGLLTDASVLSSIVDGVVLVVRKGFYDKKMVLNTKKGLDRMQANICGVVFNQADLKSDGYYYNYGDYVSGNTNSR